MITKTQAKEFFHKLKVLIYGEPGDWAGSQVKISPTLISKYLNITEEESIKYCNAIVDYGISVFETKMLIL